MIAWAAMGDANASIPTPQPILPRPMFGAAPGVAPGAVGGVGRPGGARRRARRPARASGARLVPVADTRSLGKADMPENDAMPDIAVDPDTFAVRIDGELVDRSARRRAADGAALLPVLTCVREFDADDADQPRPRCCSPTAGSRPGGHAHSAGVEAAVARRRRPSTSPTLERYLPAGWRRPGVVDAAFAAAACRRRSPTTGSTCSTPSSTPGMLSPRLARDQPPAGPPAAARRRARLAERAARSPRRAVGGPHQPIVLGVVVAASGGVADDAAALALHHLAAAVTSPAVRLLGLDPIAVLAVQARALPLDRRARRRRPTTGRRPRRPTCRRSAARSPRSSPRTTRSWDARLFVA